MVVNVLGAVNEDKINVSKLVLADKFGLNTNVSPMLQIPETTLVVVNVLEPDNVSFVKLVVVNLG